MHEHRPDMPAPLGMQRHFIDGSFRDSLDGRTFDTLDPSTNHVLTSVASAAERDVDSAVRAARRAFDEGPWPRLSTSDRARALQRIARLVVDHADAFIGLEVRDVGMPITQMRALAARTAENFEYYARVVQELTGRSFQVGEGFLNYTFRKPAGVVGAIMPWNAPLMLSTWRIAPALAAGNCVVLKPAEWAPLSSTHLAEVLAEADLPPGVFNVVHGFGETAGAALAAHQGVDLICFTGEPATGAKIVAAGASSLKRTSLELGGKSPVIVFEDAHPELVVDAALAQIFTMNGQRCTAGSRLLVQRPLYEEIVDAVAARAKRIRVGLPTDPSTELGPLIHPEHLARVRDYIEGACEDGAALVAGGGRTATPERGNFLEATVLRDVPPGTRAFEEEIFGPVLVATPFEDESEAVRLANATPYGLAAYVWTRDVQRALRVAHAVDTGMCWVNSQNVRDLRTPFGGVKQSGIGREGGDYAFDFYCDTEVVHLALGGHHIPRLGVD